MLEHKGRDDKSILLSLGASCAAKMKACPGPGFRSLPGTRATAHPYTWYSGGEELAGLWFSPRLVFVPH